MEQSPYVLNTKPKRSYKELVDSDHAYKVIGSDVPKTIDEQALNEGEIAFAINGSRVTADQQLEVFTNLASVPLEVSKDTGPDFERRKRQKLHAKIRPIGRVTTTINYRDHRPTGAGQLAVQVGGSGGILNTGNVTLRAGEYVYANIPDFSQSGATSMRNPDGSISNRRPVAQTIGFTAQLLRDEISKRTDNTDLLYTNIFKKMLDEIIYPIIVMLRNSTTAPAGPPVSGVAPLHPVNPAGRVVLDTITKNKPTPGDLDALTENLLKSVNIAQYQRLDVNELRTHVQGIVQVAPYNMATQAVIDTYVTRVIDEVAVCKQITARVNRALTEHLKREENKDTMTAIASANAGSGGHSALKMLSYVVGKAMEDIPPGTMGDFLWTQGPAVSMQAIV